MEVINLWKSQLIYLIVQRMDSSYKWYFQNFFLFSRIFNLMNYIEDKMLHFKINKRAMTLIFGM